MCVCVCVCVCACVHVCVCVCVCVCLGSLPVKEGGRELVHCTLSQLMKIFFLYSSFSEVYVCAIWYRVS